MPHLVGYVDQSNGQWAHYNMLSVIHEFARDNGWDVLRYDDTVANRELILKGHGFGGDEEIFIGFRTYQNPDADYYNLVAAGFIGYLQGNSLDAQPGAILSGVPAHNQRIDYWLTLNPQRIALAMKVGTPVYQSAYVGLMTRFARPDQYPYPLVCAGMLNGTPATRFSDTTHSMPYKGARSNLRLRFNDGSWKQPSTWPWDNGVLTASGASWYYDRNHARDTGSYYPPLPVQLGDDNGLYGALDGIHYVSGFNNAVENTIDGGRYVVIQDVARTGFPDYYAMRLDD